MNKEVLEIIRERGLLLEKEVYELVDFLDDSLVVGNFLETIEKSSGEKIITKNILNQNVEFVKSAILGLVGKTEEQKSEIILKLGFGNEEKNVGQKIESGKKNYQVVCAETSTEKKLEVKDFVGHFRARYQQLQRILLKKQELQNGLVSIGKISSDRASLSIIGIVTEKRITKNKNLIIKFEDLTGEINVLVKFNDKDLFEKAAELQLDDVVGVRVSGSREFLFAHEIIFPDSFLEDRMKFDEDISVAFLSDLHTGSNKHLKKSFEKFLKFLGSEDEVAKKIKYIFFTGDNVDGVGIFPGQENVLNLKSMGLQYAQVVEYLKQVPKNIIMFMCPGQNDATRVAEPQPIISKKYAPELYKLENLVLVTNPAIVKLSEGKKEFKVLMYHGASLHSFINEIKELRDVKAHTCPARAVKHLLKRRHLAPTHSSVVYIPNMDLDPLVINEVPDVITTGEVHRTDVDNYNGTLIVACSCWQAQTSFEEKIGNVPDPCKVPILNLKSREMKILDFRDESEVDENGSWKGVENEH